MTLTLLFVAAVRFHLRSMPLERDEGEYAYAGQLMLDGQPPYREVYNMKLPGTYAAYALIMALFGQSPSGIHFGVMLVNLASIVLVFLIGCRLHGELTGVTAAVSYGLLSLSPSLYGLAGHATHFVVLAALAGTLLLLSSVSLPHVLPEKEGEGKGRLRKSMVVTFLAGLLFGLAFLMKQHGVFFGIFGGVYLVWTFVAPRLARDDVRRRQLSFTSYVSRFVLFSAGFVLPYALTCFILWHAGVFHQFYFWTVSYASKYATSVPIRYMTIALGVGLSNVVGPNILLWLLPWVGLVWGFVESPRTRVQSPESKVPHPRFFLVALLLASIGSVSAGLAFRPHYFITMLPVMSLLSGVAVSRAWELLQKSSAGKAHRGAQGIAALGAPASGVVIAVFCLGVGAAIVGHSSVWFAAPDKAEWNVYGTTCFTESAAVADYIKSQTSKDARIAVVGSEPEIYFLSHRRSATGYIYTYPLMEKQALALQMQNEMLAEIERNKPEYVVYVKDDLSWLPHRSSERKIFEWWDQYWAANLDLVNTVKIAQMGDENNPVPPERYLLVLKRKPKG